MDLAVSWPIGKKIFVNPGEISAHPWDVPKGGYFYSLLDSQSIGLSTFCFAPDDKGAGPVNVHADVDEVLPSLTQTRTMTVSDVGPITLTADRRDLDVLDPMIDNWNVTEDTSYFSAPRDLVVDQSVFTIAPPDNGEFLATVTIADSRFGLTWDDEQSYVGCITVMDVAQPLPIDAAMMPEIGAADANFTPAEAGALAINFTNTIVEREEAEALADLELPAEKSAAALKPPLDRPFNLLSGEAALEDAPAADDGIIDDAAVPDEETGPITWGGASAGAFTSDASAILPPTRMRFSAGTFNQATAISDDCIPADNIAASAGASDAISFGVSGKDVLTGGNRDDILSSGDTASSATFNTLFPISIEWPM